MHLLAHLWRLRSWHTTVSAVSLRVSTDRSKHVDRVVCDEADKSRAWAAGRVEVTKEMKGEVREGGGSMGCGGDCSSVRV